MENETSENNNQNLSTQVTNGAVQALNTQRKHLNEFIKTQLKEKVDYGILPGVKKPSLYKPGAEKLCQIFMLGSRIVADKTEINHENKFAMATYRVEVFHIPTGSAIAQCEGSVNAYEKKYRTQDMYSIVNTLQKMAQKRAFVGATILACNASDFFTQDVEDMDLAPSTPDNYEITEDSPITWGKYKDKGTVGKAAQDPAFLQYCDWIMNSSLDAKGYPLKDKKRFYVEAKAWKEWVENGEEVKSEPPTSQTSVPKGEGPK